MMTVDPLTRAGQRTTRALWITTPAASIFVVGALAVWTLSTELLLRRAALIACILTIFACMMTLLIAKRGTGRATLAQAYAAVLPPGGAASDHLPANVPSGNSLRIRGLAGMVAFLAALVGVWALVGSDDRHASTAADIRAAGAHVIEAPVTKVADVERYTGRGDTDYSATFTVLLDDPASDSTPVTLTARTRELPKEGGTLAVMYAPSNLQLGAVHGDRETLSRLMSGKAMTPGLTWGLTLAWLGIAALIVGGTALTGGFRTVTRLEGARAVRGNCAGSGRWDTRTSQNSASGEGLIVRTENGGQLRFWHERQAPAIAEVAGSESVWVCWEDPGSDSSEAKKTPAVLVADSGWVLHGEVWAEQAQSLRSHSTTAGSPNSPTDGRRKVKLWNPATSWPLLLRGASMLWLVLALASAAVCVTDFGVRWRWTIGIVCTVALLGAVASYVIRATKHVKGSLRKPSPTRAA